ncbi:unnamed protein product [Ambrosiozyma monospora]|uniref:Unnamed protein product n=1 Tax=Ambrosiozyma monospora TaxID=43982 RepID=A0ACB5T9Z4_AMBMO|nr:unnamed protein product [Ambrosiozyma monospora]
MERLAALQGVVVTENNNTVRGIMETLATRNAALITEQNATLSMIANFEEHISTLNDRLTRLQTNLENNGIPYDQ